MKKLKSAVLICSALILGLLSCKKEDTSTSLPAGPQDTVTSFVVYFYNTVDSISEVGIYEDVDGPGPIAPTIGGVSLKKNTEYILTFSIEDATNPSKKVNLHNKIKSNGKEYKLCISNPFGIDVTPLDSDGSHPIGLEDALVTKSTTGTGKLDFTIKYQKGVKNGQCEAGVVYYTCSLPFGVY